MPNFKMIDNENFAFDLLGSSVLLTRKDNIWSITGPDLPSPIALNPPDANAAMIMGQRTGPQPEILNLGLDPRHDVLASDVNFLRSQIGETDSVLLDTTTLASATLALNSRPSPASLLDLSTVTSAFILYEQVVVQGSAHHSGIHEVPATLKHVLKILNYGRSVISGTLWSENVKAAYAATEEAPNPIINAWREFFGRDEISLNRSIWDRQQDSPAGWDGIPATYYFDNSLPSAPLHTTESLQSLNDFLSVQTIRTIFNDNLAAMLNVPYIPTSIRSPVYSVLLSQKIKTQHLADRLLGQIGPPPLETPNTAAYVAELSVPFLLGIAFSRMGNVEDYWRIIEDLRNSFAPLRARLSADRNEWQGRSGAYLSEYLKHLKGYMPPGLQVAQGAASGAGTVVSVAASPLGGGFVDLAVKLARAWKTTEKAYAWYLKRFRPYIHVIIEMATEAKALRAVETEIERLWGSTWTRGDHDQLERLSISRPEMFSRLRKLDVPT